MSNNKEQPEEENKTPRQMHQEAEKERLKEVEKEKELSTTVFDGVRSDDGTPVQPVKMTAKDNFCFSCHKGVSCWNKCCHGADITLTPFDILRLSKRLDIRPADFLKMFTVPSFWDKANLPVAKLKFDGADGKGACAFLDEEDGCTIYEDRPVNCRYYPLGMAAIKMKGQENPEDFFFLVKENHCKGHEESKDQTVDEFREEQGIDSYDLKNRGWIEILMKMASWNVMGGPYGQQTDERTKKMFFMVTTDVDAFRRFVFDSKFLQTYIVDPELVDRLREDDDLLLQLSFDWLKKILFNDDTIQMRQEVLNAAIAKAREGTE